MIEVDEVTRARIKKEVLEQYSKDVETEINARIRAEQGKEPKILPGEKAEEEKKNRMMGYLADLIIGNIAFAEFMLDQKMFFSFDINLKDTRRLHIKLDGGDTHENSKITDNNPIP